MREISKKDLYEHIKKEIKRIEEEIKQDVHKDDKNLHLGIKIGYEQMMYYIMSR